MLTSSVRKLVSCLQGTAEAEGYDVTEMHPVTLYDISLQPLPAEAETPVEKRTWLRLRDKRIKVSVVDACTRKLVCEGWVIDRSQGGLGIAVPRRMNEGTLLTVRALTQECQQGVAVEVRHCRPEEDHWVIGCEFLRAPNWKVLLQFS